MHDLNTGICLSVSNALGTVNNPVIIAAPIEVYAMLFIAVHVLVLFACYCMRLAEPTTEVGIFGGMYLACTAPGVLSR